MKKMNLLTKTVLALAAFAAIACGKKSNDDDGNIYYPPGGGGCFNGICQAGSGNLLSNVQFQTSGNHFQGAISLSGQGGNYDFNDPRVAVIYQGPVTLQGQLQVLAQDGYLCGARPGTYTLTTISPGLYQMGYMTSLRIQASGPDQIIFDSEGAPSELTNPQEGLNRNSPHNRAGLNLFAIVNGQRCGWVATF